jgi:hypothetical protein
MSVAIFVDCVERYSLFACGETDVLSSGHRHSDVDKKKIKAKMSHLKNFKTN